MSPVCCHEPGCSRDAVAWRSGTPTCFECLAATLAREAALAAEADAEADDDANGRQNAPSAPRRAS